MKKPDRWERMVKDCREKDGGLWTDNVAALLRRQHAATVRIVKKLADGMAEPISDIQDGYHMACAEILDALERRRR